MATSKRKRAPAAPAGIDIVAPLPSAKGVPIMPKSPARAAAPSRDAEVIEATQPAKQPGTALVSYKERMAALVATTKKAEAPQGGFISLKNGRMAVGETRFPNDMIRAIVVEYRKDNEFYEAAYEAGKSAAPVCSAIVRPHEISSPWRARRPDDDDTRIIFDQRTGLVTEAIKPQVPAGAGCDSCPMLEWGSAKKIIGKMGSGKGKACRESRRLHICAADQCTNPEDAARAPFLTLIPPPTSLDNFKRFANECSTVLDVPVFGAVVEISVQPHDQYQFMVHYKIVEKIKDEGVLNALLTRHEQLAQRSISVPRPDDSDAVKDNRGAGNGKF